MNDFQKYPLALQLLMQTDGTVTELIKLLANEDVQVVKLSESFVESPERLLYRRIYLQGKQSLKNWLYAESKIYLDNLPKNFVSDLLHKSLPIGTLWNDYRIETFKKIINKQAIHSQGVKQSGFDKDSPLLTRSYQVYNQGLIIMEIQENFPINHYQDLVLMRSFKSLITC
jgi:chorismate-pyruvate lyase